MTAAIFLMVVFGILVAGIVACVVLIAVYKQDDVSIACLLIALTLFIGASFTASAVVKRLDATPKAGAVAKP